MRAPLPQTTLQIIRRFTVIFALALGAIIAVAPATAMAAEPAVAADAAWPAADSVTATETFTVRNSILRPNTREDLPAWTCPSWLPFLVDQRDGSNAPPGVAVVADPRIHVIVGSAPVVRGGYALGWSADTRRAFALHYDPTLEAGPQGYVINATCTNDIKLAYKP
jgi:hypothetical protein